MAAWQYNVERGKGNGKERQLLKGRDKKGRSGLSPSKKIPAGTHGSIYYYWFIDGNRLIETDSSFQISLRLYWTWTLLLHKFFTQS